MLKNFAIKLLSYLGVRRSLKLNAELRFWKLWDQEIREKGYWNEDILKDNDGIIGTHKLDQDV